MSLNQWIAAAVAQKVGVAETAAHFLIQRAGDAKPKDLLSFLDKAPDVPPDAGDEIAPRIRRATRASKRKPVRSK